ncbi:12880_t:CDS:2, partial [Ambispora gerdemannii]
MTSSNEQQQQNEERQINVELGCLSTVSPPLQYNEQQEHLPPNQHEEQQNGNAVDTLVMTIPPPTYACTDCIFNADADTLETSPPAYHTLFSLFHSPITAIDINNSNSINPNCQQWIRHFEKEDEIEQQRIQRQMEEQQRQQMLQQHEQVQIQ